MTRAEREERAFRTLLWAVLLGGIGAALLVILGGCTISVTELCQKHPEICYPPTPAPTATPTPMPTATPTPTPTPAATPTPSPFGEDDPLPELEGGATKEQGGVGLDVWAHELSGAIDIACGGCADGTVLTDHVAFIKAVRDVLKYKYAYHAAYDWEHGNPDHTGSELSMWRGCHYESHQIVTSAKKVRRPSGSFRGFAGLKQCVADCPLDLPLPAGYELGLRVGPHGQSGQQYDATPYLQDRGGPFPPAAWTGSCRAHQCDLGAEKDAESGKICTVQLCGASIDYTLSSGVINWVQGYTVKITPDAPAVLKGCCADNPAVCASLTVAR